MTLHIVPSTALAEMVACDPCGERFGPMGPCSYLAVEVQGQISAHVEEWMKALPCPVIAIGGPPQQAWADLVLTVRDGLSSIARNIEQAPFAAMILVQQLRLAEHLPLPDALICESLAYATAQRSPDFEAWKQSAPSLAPQPPIAAPLTISRGHDRLNLTLNTPDRRNAIDIAMRDALCEALDLAILDTSIERITLNAAGRCFSTGGAVEEFGSVTDPATAHAIRMARLPARRLAKLKDRLCVHAQGATIGAGLEMGAFAARFTCSADAWFQLPELRYGLIPGAGGTVSISKRIGRHRTALLALSMRRISARDALAWGLVDAVIPEMEP